MPPKNKKTSKKTKFLVKDRASMIANLKKGEHIDVVEAALEILPSGVHLQLYESRKKFVSAFSDNKTRTS